MAFFRGPNVVTDGLVLALDAANPKNFPEGEPTTNIFPSPVSLGSNRVTAAQIGAIFTDFTTGSFNNGPFVRLTRNVNSIPSPTTAWDFEYSNTSTGYPDGTKFAFSFYARSIDGSTPTIKMSNPDAEAQTFNLTTQWQRFVGIFTLGIQITGNLWIRINRSNQQWVSGSSYDISNAQMEYKTYATPFVNGSRTLWYDTSGNNNSGSLVNGPTYSSANGGIIVFDGTNDYVQVSRNTNFAFGTNDFSVDYWFNKTGSGNSAMMDCTSPGGFGFNLINNTQIFAFQSFGSSYTINCNFLYNTWNNITLIRSGGSLLSAYVNGNFVGSNNSVSASFTSNGNEVFGINANLSTNPFPGYVSTIKIYNKSITSSEVLQNYNAQKSRFNLN